jgi:hypothetical protein
MFSRLLTVALLTAGTALAFSTAQAQTSGSSSGSTTAPSTTSPSTGSSGSSGSTMGSSGSSTSTQQAQQPMGSGTFNATNYKTKTECLNAATAQKADRKLCDALK